MDISLSFESSVAVIRWNDGENRINLDSLGRLNEILDELDRIDGPLAIVLTGTGKFFSNGLDLDRFASAPDEFVATATALHRLFGRLVIYPAYTVAAINGHAFAGGAMLSCTTDLRVMREDRGFWCLNEVELGLPLTDEMAALVMGRLPGSAAREAMLTARRFSATDALAAGIVEVVVPEADVVATAIARAGEVAFKDRKVIAIHKRQAFADVARKTGFLQ
jgi:enoyl-CoA hydratase/carnithine racemase